MRSVRGSVAALRAEPAAGGKLRLAAGALCGIAQAMAAVRAELATSRFASALRADELVLRLYIYFARLSLADITRVVARSIQ